MGSDSVNNEKILKKLDELTKLDKKILTNVKSETTLSDEEKQRLNNISESSNSVNTSADKLTKALNFVIALSLVVFAAIIIGFFPWQSIHNCNCISCNRWGSGLFSSKYKEKLDTSYLIVC